MFCKRSFSANKEIINNNNNNIQLYVNCPPSTKCMNRKCLKFK